jgi:hypothetical protein
MSRVIVHRSEWVHSSQSKNKTQAKEQGKRQKVKGKSQEPQPGLRKTGRFLRFLLLPFYFLLFTFYF